MIWLDLLLLGLVVLALIWLIRIEWRISRLVHHRISTDSAPHSPTRSATPMPEPSGTLPAGTAWMASDAELLYAEEQHRQHSLARIPPIGRSTRASTRSPRNPTG